MKVIESGALPRLRDAVLHMQYGMERPRTTRTCATWCCGIRRRSSTRRLFTRLEPKIDALYTRLEQMEARFFQTQG